MDDQQSLTSIQVSSANRHLSSFIIVTNKVVTTITILFLTPKGNIVSNQTVCAYEGKQGNIIGCIMKITIIRALIIIIIIKVNINGKCYSSNARQDSNAASR